MVNDIENLNIIVAVGISAAIILLTVVFFALKNRTDGLDSEIDRLKKALESINRENATPDGETESPDTQSRVSNKTSK
jgi:hypothetical protein